MNFTCKVRDQIGAIHESSMDAASREAAIEALHRDGFQVLAIAESAGFALFAPRIKRADIIYTTCQLAIMVDTGITLSVALAGICEQSENVSLRRLLGDLRNRVEGGEDFSSALARHPKYFDRTYVSLVKASEQTGTLGTMLERIANYMRSQLESQSKVRASMAYPGIMLILAVSVTVFLLTFILPKFTPLFARKGVKLPKPTIVMMALSDTFTNYWYLWIIGVTMAIVGYIWGRRTQPGRQILDWIKINVPILGPTFRKVIISRSISALGTMVQSGVSVLDSIRLCGEISGNYYYEKAWNRVVDEVTQGNRIADSLRGNPLFPGTLVQMIGSGEETGKLDYVLQKVSTYYDREVETSLKAATSLIEPIMITAMGTVIGGIGLGIMLPIFSLSRAGGH